MAHQSLYRRYRPQRFAEVRGQDHVVGALRAAVAEGRVGHAYLFSGPRGTGKTSTARILAKALNCEDLTDGEPCGVCDSCVAMQAGTSYDLQELDAASNNKVEDVRGLIERVALGSPGRTKVYILDEVHMLSTGASNALLKTLEEPPDHVVFVLATTDPQKVLPTIRSRTQHFVFHLLPADELAEHVRFVIGDAGLDVDDAAVEHVLRVGGGSARDTLSALDQAAAGGVNTDGDHAELLASAVMASDVGAALSAVATATIDGRDPRVLGEALLAHLRDVFLQRMGGPLGHLSDASRQRVETWATQVTDRSVTAALEQVGEALLEMRQAPDPRIPLEVALVRITRPAPAATGDGQADLTALAERVSRLEQGAVDVAAASPAAAVASNETARTTSDAGRPGDTARAVLGKHTSPPSGASAAPDPPPPPPPSPSRPRSTASDAPPPAAVSTATTQPATTQPADEVAEPTAGADASDATESSVEAPDETAAAPLSTSDVTTVWLDKVLPGLRGITKPLFALGQVVAADDDSLTLGFPNEAHVERCRQKQADAEAALAGAAGRPVRLQLVVGGDAAGSQSTDATRPAAGAEPTDPAEDIDLNTLVDAPAETRSSIDRVTEAFPGAQIVDR